VSKTWLVAGGAALSAAHSTMPASASPRQISIDCAEWQPETRAEVEARIRTALLAAADESARVSIECEAEGRTRVVIQARRGSLDRFVEWRGVRREDDVVATVDSLLSELDQPPPAPKPAPPAAEPQVAPAPTAAPESPLVPAKVPSAARVPSRPPPASTGSSVIVAGVAPVAEVWRDHLALGADFALGARGGVFGWGLLLGGANAFGEPSSFDVQEWHGQARLSRTFRRLADLDVEVGAGVSIALVTPHSSVRTDNSTVLTAAVFSLGFSRRFALGSFALAPEIGLRASAARKVQVDSQEEFRLPLLAPRAALWLLYARD